MKSITVQDRGNIINAGFLEATLPSEEVPLEVCVGVCVCWGGLADASACVLCSLPITTRRHSDGWIGTVVQSRAEWLSCWRCDGKQTVVWYG